MEVAFPKNFYLAGDSIVLKSGALQDGAKQADCRIVSILPEAGGLAQYRIRRSGENCERLVTEADIDHEASVNADTKPSTTAACTSGSWININAIKIRK